MCSWYIDENGSNVEACIKKTECGAHGKYQGIYFAIVCMPNSDTDKRSESTIKWEGLVNAKKLVDLKTNV